MDILDAEPNPTECMGESDDVNFKKELAHVPLPSGSQCLLSIRRIPSFAKDLFDSELRLDGLKGVCFPNNDEVKSICRAHAPSLVPRPQHPLRAPQGGIFIFNADAVIKEVDKNVVRIFGVSTPIDGLHSLKGDFDSLYATILQIGVEVTTLKSKKDLNSQVWPASICFKKLSGKLLTCRIDITSATEMTDVAIKATLEKIEAYIKDSFKDLKNFQWNPLLTPFF
ncbi:LOW QUALITY PROTEIN: hypothetical protein Cgig2_002571 [Carnegiea gigantea]|uniref:Uncharacterized protein n=1 Tax=Carnegiea gigantea TaxID=171969 RepID=A0A9Q1GQB3_9CARY|nr:LOW QUALITY PROTEIN: hypothetical protein Cgig2_002571 [Carnegiea gigantea]